MISISGVQISPTKFPDGTSQVWKLPENILRRRLVSIVWEFVDESEFIHLAQLKALLDHAGIEASLDMPYLPYARQDKECLNDQTFALRPFAELLNSLKFKKVYAVDPHSEVAGELIKNFTVIHADRWIRATLKIVNPDMVFFPDISAFSRYGSLVDCLQIGWFEKWREPKTGEIKMTRMISSSSPAYKSILLIDDICDGGATFIKCAESLRETNSDDIWLYITHGIFSKGLQPLKDAGISRFFTREGEVIAFRQRGSFQNGIVYQPFKEEQ